MYRSITLLFLVIYLSGCSGVQTYPNIAQAGDTVSLAMGWQKNFKRSNTTVSITPSVGAPVIYQPGDPNVRAIINFYPDPLSNIVIGTKLGDNTTYKYGATYGNLINGNFTDGDMEWWQTVAFIDLPDYLPLGETNIELTNTDGLTASSIVNIIDGAGQPETFAVENNGPLDPNQLASLERASNFEVSLVATTLPYSVEMVFSYTGTIDIVNPSDLKNITWTGDGSSLKVYLMPASLDALTNIHDFKYYITGIAAQEWVQEDIEPLLLQSINAYDKDGNPVSGVSASVTADFR